MKSLRTLIAAVFLLALSSGAAAALVESGWPPPGGASHTISPATPGELGGKSFVLSGFDDFFYDELYYSIHPADSGENRPRSMTFNADASDLPNGVSVWDSTLDVYDEEADTTVAVTGKFVLTVTDTNSKALPLINASSLGLDANLGGVLQVTDDFVGNWAFYVNDTSKLPWHDKPSKAPEQPLVPSVENAFYYSSRTDIPVPGAAWLFGSALFGLLTISRRRSGHESA